MTQATYDFKASDADLILVSCEQESPAQFHVHRSILAAASPFFHDMLTLPQPTTPNEPPLVSVSETCGTLDTLLRFVYPLPDPVINSLDELVPILAAAAKYDFTAVISALRKLLVQPHFIKTSPTRVYAIACRYDLEHEAKFASSFTLGSNILDSPLSDDLKYITAFSYHRLLDLHRRRALAAQALLKIPDDIKCMQCNGSSYTVFGSPKWWFEFEKRAREELATRPTTEVIFGMEFLAKSANSAGCQRCPGSVLESWRFLEELKRSIDNLPSTI